MAADLVVPPAIEEVIARFDQAGAAIDEHEVKQALIVGMFPNEPASTRLVGALLLEQKDEWQLQRRYMHFEGLQSLGDNQAARLSAVVNRARAKANQGEPRLATRAPRPGARSNHRCVPFFCLAMPGDPSQHLNLPA